MPDVASAITALATLVAAVGAVLVGYRNSRKSDVAKEKAIAAASAALAAKETAERAVEEHKREVILVGDKVVEIGKQIDGRLTELLTQARALALAEGRAQGEQAERDRAGGGK